MKPAGRLVKLRLSSQARGARLGALRALAGAAALMSCLGAPAAAASLLRTVDGEEPPAPVQLVSVDSQWQIAFRAEDGVVSLAAEDVLVWGERRSLPQTGHALLVDGGILAGELTALDGNRITLDSWNFGLAALPLDRVRGYVFHPPADALAHDRLLHRIATASGDRDRILLDNGDELEGVLVGLDAAEGGGGEAAAQPLRLRIAQAGADTFAPLDNVTAILFNPALAEARPSRGPRMLWGLSDGSVLEVARLAVREGEASLTLAAGPALSADADTLWQDTSLLQPLGGRVTYLSERAPLGYRHVPFLTTAWPYHLDRSALGGLLRHEGRIVSRGIGMHSAARLAFALDESFARFEAELALDERAERRGSVIYRVYLADRSGAWTRAYESGTIRGGQPPQTISVALDGAVAIALLVDFADRGDERDYANWLNARLIKR